jgi:hypothetical protein
MIGIFAEEFGQTHFELASNPQFAEFVAAAMQGKLAQPHVSVQPKLTKQDTLNHLKKYEEVLKQMKDIKLPVQEPTNQQEHIAMMTKMMTEHMKLQDKMFIDSGEKIENEEFEAAMMYYSAKDRDVSAAMQRHNFKMRSFMGPEQ